MLFFLKQMPFVGITVVTAVGYDDMIQQTDFEQFGSLLKALRQLIVGFAGLSVARWMIMTQNQSRGQQLCRRFQDNTQIGCGFAGSALADFLFPDHFGGAVEQNNP